MLSITLATFICVIYTMWMTSSEKMFADLRKRNGVMRSGVLSKGFVSSGMHCLHKCRRTVGCSGMNLGKDGNGQLTCQLTSTKVASDADDEGMLEEKDGWDYYQVVDVISEGDNVAQKKFNVYLSSYAQQETASKLQPSDLSRILVNGARSSVSKGINIISLQYDDVSFRLIRRCKDSSEYGSCVSFLNKQKRGSIIGIVVVDTAVGSIIEAFPTSLKAALQRVGVNQTNIGYRQPFCFINMVDTPVAWRQEVLKRNASEPSICQVDIY